eukprot:gb/GECG01012751.1/.p1 GENE.gb/GECG01012751.1/~~gb/GECG01012751.1/.p1  ORF type:complete len:123 (+),score=8.48 gb/GECG01012751.1/:1-369(+)
MQVLSLKFRSFRATWVSGTFRSRILFKAGEVNLLNELMILLEGLGLLRFQSADVTDSWRKITLVTAGTGPTGEEWNAVPDVSTTAMVGECVTEQTLTCVTASTHCAGQAIDARQAAVDQTPG